MQDYVKDKVQPNDKELVSSLVHGFDNSFQAYKKSANVNRTFIYCNLKEKVKTRAQRRLEDTVAECKLDHTAERQRERRAALAREAVSKKPVTNFWRARELCAKHAHQHGAADDQDERKHSLPVTERDHHHHHRTIDHDYNSEK